MTKKIIRIGSKKIGPGRPVYIIAEAGVNHNAKLDFALKLVDAAAAAGADAVKFQTFRAGDVTTDKAKMAAYQVKNLGKKQSQLEMIKKLEIPEEYYPAILKRCRGKKIDFLSTPHGGFRSVDFLQKLKIQAYKIGSGDITNIPLLEYTAELKKPIIISTGMANMKEIKEAVSCIERKENKNIIILHCTTNYPCPLNEVNLKAMQTMQKEFKDYLVGYSDHTLGTLVSTLAAFLGAFVIEKHLTLDKNLPGPDHRASADPQEFKELVSNIRSLETIMGNAQKKPAKSELKYIPLVRKSIVASRDIEKGGKFTQKNLSIKRPGTGLHPRNYSKILEKTAKKTIKAGSLIKPNDY